MARIVFILLLTSISVAGSKAQPKLLPTNLRITVIDGLGNFVEDATVTIYESQDDYLNGANPVAMLRSDKKGVVKFKKLKPIAYYIDARKGDQNNDGEGVATAALQEGRTNKVNTVIE